MTNERLKEDGKADKSATRKSFLEKMEEEKRTQRGYWFSTDVIATVDSLVKLTSKKPRDLIEESILEYAQRHYGFASSTPQPTIHDIAKQCNEFYSVMSNFIVALYSKNGDDKKTQSIVDHINASIGSGLDAESEDFYKNLPEELRFIETYEEYRAILWALNIKSLIAKTNE